MNQKGQFQDTARAVLRWVSSKANCDDVGNRLNYHYKLYDIEVHMTRFIYTCPDGIKPTKTNEHDVLTGIRTQYKLYDTEGRLTDVLLLTPVHIHGALHCTYRPDYHLQTNTPAAV